MLGNQASLLSIDEVEKYLKITIFLEKIGEARIINYVHKKICVQNKKVHFMEVKYGGIGWTKFSNWQKCIIW